MHLVFDVPVAAHRPHQALGISTQTGDEKPLLQAGLRAKAALGFDKQDAAQIRPALGINEPLVCDLQGVAAPLFDTAMLAIKRLMPITSAILLRGQTLEEIRDLVVEPFLVVFEAQHVVSALIADLLGDGSLATDRVNRDDAPRDIKHCQKLRYGADFIGVIVDLDLAQDEMILYGPSPDHFDSSLVRGAVVAAPQVLAVNGDDLAFGKFSDALNPIEEALLEGVWINPGEHVADGVVRGNAVGQLQEALEPVVLGAAKLFDADEGIGPADDRTDGQGEDVFEQVELGALDAGILDVGEAVCEGERTFSHGLIGEVDRREHRSR